MGTEGINDIHEDLLIEILSRSSPKQLGAAACVSKSWNRLISKDLQARRYLPPRMAGIFHYGFYNSEVTNFVPTVQGLHSLIAHIDTELGFLPHRDIAKVCASCNGLLLCLLDDGLGWVDPLAPADRDRVYVVCNPATNEFRVLPPAHGWAHEVGLAYDITSNSTGFTVVRYLSQELSGDDVLDVQVLSSETMQWKKIIRFTLPHPIILAYRKKPVYHKGLLYLLADPSHLLMFDVKKEVLIVEEVPGEMMSNEYFLGVLGVSEGVLQYVNTTTSTRVKEGAVQILQNWVYREDGKYWDKYFVEVDHSVVSPSRCDFNILFIHPDVAMVFMKTTKGKFCACHLENGTWWEFYAGERPEEDVAGLLAVACSFSPCFVSLKSLTEKGDWSPAGRPESTRGFWRRVGEQF